MIQVDKAVKKETTYVIVWVFLLSLLMEAVFLVLGRWELSVLWGNLLSAVAVSVNFFLMALGVQKALTKETETEQKNVLRISRTYRTLALLVIMVLGAVLPVFHLWATLIPLFFPRIAITFRPLYDRKHS